MKKRIILILVLMSVCVSGITALQLFWNYQNYQSTIKTFEHDINAALNTAAARELTQRHEKIESRFKQWLADTSFITITCDINNRSSSTVFHVADTHPYFKDDKPFSFGLTYFKEKLRHITPSAKAMFIAHFSDRILKPHLQSGMLYYYTQRLGDSLERLYNNSPRNMAALNKLYREELLNNGIDAPFTLNPAKGGPGISFYTKNVNTAIKRPYIKELVFAGFESPGVYFLKEMKWVVISSFLLIGLTVFCYAYTVKTILTQQKLAALKDDFVNNMTHELKTPVATINIAAEAIQDFNLSKASADEYLGIIRYQAGNLTNLIDQILKNVVSEQSGAAPELTRLNISQLVNQILSEYKPQYTAANITISYLPGGEVFVMADGGLLKNAIGNLIDNAIKYSGPDSTITITQQAGNGNLIIKVEDNGPGIPAQYQAKVFERFFRVPTGNIHNVKGYGLGLSYAKSIIEKHKGTLSLISVEGRGTEFIISLPLIYHEAGQGFIVGG